jgi:hypothetical protein
MAREKLPSEDSTKDGMRDEKRWGSGLVRYFFFSVAIHLIV